MKIYSFTSGEIIIDPIGDRKYRIRQPVTISIISDCGVIRVSAKEGFVFDGRSGGPLADFILPNLGTQRLTACWLCHDILGHDFDISFETTNMILKQMLLQAGTSRFKAWLAWRAVSLSRSWFGCSTDKEIANKEHCQVRIDDE